MRYTRLVSRPRRPLYGEDIEVFSFYPECAFCMVRYRRKFSCLPSKTNVPFKILRTGTVCRYLGICVCQGQYSVGTAGWCTLNWLYSYNEQDHHEFKIQETVVPLISLCRGLKLMCPYETCTVPDHWPNFPMIQHCAGLIRAHKYALRCNGRTAEAR